MQSSHLHTTPHAKEPPQQADGWRTVALRCSLPAGPQQHQDQQVLRKEVVLLLRLQQQGAGLGKALLRGGHLMRHSLHGCTHHIRSTVQASPAVIHIWAHAPLSARRPTQD